MFFCINNNLLTWIALKDYYQTQTKNMYILASYAAFLFGLSTAVYCCCHYWFCQILSQLLKNCRHFIKIASQFQNKILQRMHTDRKYVLLLMIDPSQLLSTRAQWAQTLKWPFLEGGFAINGEESKRRWAQQTQDRKTLGRLYHFSICWNHLSEMFCFSFSHLTSTNWAISIHLGNYSSSH